MHGQEASDRVAQVHSNYLRTSILDFSLFETCKIPRIKLLRENSRCKDWNFKIFFGEVHEFTKSLQDEHEIRNGYLEAF